MRRWFLATLLVVVAVMVLGAPAGAVPARSITITAGETVPVTGRGCASGATVEITLGAAHASGLVLASFPADRTGRFSRSVVIPSTDQPTASLVVTCTVPGGNTDIVYVADLSYRASSLALTGLKSSAPLVLAAFGLVALGLGMLMSGTAKPFRSGCMTARHLPTRRRL